MLARLRDQALGVLVGNRDRQLREQLLHRLKNRRGMREFWKDDESDRQKRRAAFDRGIDHLQHAVGIRSHLPPFDRIWQIGLTGRRGIPDRHP